jgi:hypothetical protein
MRVPEWELLGDTRQFLALLTSSMSGAVPQTVEIVGQPEKQGLADLRGQAAPGRARGELAFDGREDGFDLIEVGASSPCGLALALH